MNYMLGILDEMRIHPGMYLGERSLENLHAYMNGYMYRIFQEEDIVPEFYPGFQEYVAELYGVTTGQHWTRILDFYSSSEGEALAKFFQHLDEYTELDEGGESDR